jgi:hypothetical protein
MFRCCCYWHYNRNFADAKSDEKKATALVRLGVQTNKKRQILAAFCFKIFEIKPANQPKQQYSNY